MLELENAASEDATIWSAFQQLATYQAEIPALFANKAVLIISDGVEARVGSLGAGREWFKPWRTVSGEALADAHLPALQVVIEGLLAPRRFLDLVRTVRANVTIDWTLRGNVRCPIARAGQLQLAS